MKFLLALIAVSSVAACSDTQKAHWTAIGSDGDIVCYSGTEKIYEGRSSGKIHTVENSDGWEFMDSTTRRLVRVTGACVIRN